MSCAAGHTCAVALVSMFLLRCVALTGVSLAGCRLTIHLALFVLLVSACSLVEIRISSTLCVRVSYYSKKCCLSLRILCRVNLSPFTNVVTQKFNFASTGCGGTTAVQHRMGECVSRHNIQLQLQLCPTAFLLQKAWPSVTDKFAACGLATLRSCYNIVVWPQFCSAAFPLRKAWPSATDKLQLAL